MSNQTTRYPKGRPKLKVAPEHETIIKVYAEQVGKKIGRLVSEIIADGLTLLWVVRDQIILHFEPHSPYDGNAIMVLTAAGQQLGYINRSLAARLALNLDTHGKDVDGVVEYLFRNATGINRGLAIRFCMPDLP